MICKTCEEKGVTDYTVEEVFDYSSGAMFGGGAKAPTKWKCEFGHTWEEE